MNLNQGILLALLGLNQTKPGAVRQLVFNSKTGDISIATSADGEIGEMKLRQNEYAVKNVLKMQGKKGKYVLALVGNFKDGNAPDKQQVKQIACVLDAIKPNEMAAMHPIGDEYETRAYGIEFDSDGPRVVVMGEIFDFTTEGGKIHALTDEGLQQIDADTFGLTGVVVPYIVDDADQTPRQPISISRPVATPDGTFLRFLNLQDGKPRACTIQELGDGDTQLGLKVVGKTAFIHGTTVFGPVAGNPDMVALDMGGQYAEVSRDQFLADALPAQYATAG